MVSRIPGSQSYVYGTNNSQSLGGLPNILNHHRDSFDRGGGGGGGGSSWSRSGTHNNSTGWGGRTGRRDPADMSRELREMRQMMAGMSGVGGMSDNPISGAKTQFQMQQQMQTLSDFWEEQSQLSSQGYQTMQSMIRNV